MKSTSLSSSRFVIALWLLLALVLLQFGRLHQLEKRLNALTVPVAQGSLEMGEQTKSPSISEDLLSFLDAFGTSKELEQRETANLEAVKAYFKTTDWKAQNLSVQNLEGIPTEDGLSFVLISDDLTLVTVALDHEGLFSVRTYRDALQVDGPESFDSTKIALENYLKSPDFSDDRAAAQAVKTAEQNFSNVVLGDDTVFAALQAKGMKLDYSEEDLEEQRLIFTNVELTPVLMVTVQKNNAVLEARVLTGLQESLALQGTDADVAPFLALLEKVDARSKVEQVVGDRQEELKALLSDEATQSILERHGLKSGERTEDVQFFVYPLLNTDGVTVADILLERASGDVKVRFDGQVWNLVEATESLQTVKKNS